MIDVRYSYHFLQNSTLKAHKDNYFEENSLSIIHYYNCYGLPYKKLSKGEINYVGGGLKVSDILHIGTLYDFDSCNC